MSDHRIRRARHICLTLLALLLLFAGCVATVTCTEDRECRGSDLEPGVCLHDGRTGRYCAIFSFSCPWGWRWKYNAEDSIRETCVPPELVPPKDGGADSYTPPPDAGADR